MQKFQQSVVLTALAWGMLNTAAPAVEISDVPLDWDGRPAEAQGVVSGQVVSADGRVYQTRYWPGLWTGDVLALPGNPFTGQVESDPQGALWRAAHQLDSGGVVHEARRIVTYGGIWLEPQGVPFRYDHLSELQKTLLGWDGVRDSEADRTARDFVDYLRGAHSPKFRLRPGLLGDIVHAAPVLAGETLFVGANDGMLHAFDVHSGRERFAYVPHLVFGRLAELGRPDYDANHRFFVDGTPHVGEVEVDRFQRTTYLVGGLGKGGRGYYCLRIGSRRRSWEGDGFGPYRSEWHVDHIGPDDDERQVAEMVVWEYPPPPPFLGHGSAGGESAGTGATDSDPDMGYTFGQGYAVNANAPEGGYRPVVIFGNGYNSPNGRAVLYILDAFTGAVIRKIDTGAGGDNGLSIPALVDVSFNHRVDYVYAGDLQGNLWKFDLTDADPLRWGVAYGDDPDRDGVIDAAHGDRPEPLFRAPGQPITGRPDVMAMHGGCGPGGGGYLVVFGTGRFLGPPDRLDTDGQTLYGLWDAGDQRAPLGRITRRDEGRLSSGRRLVRREVAEWSDRDGQPVRRLSDWVAGVADEPEEGAAGWFFDLPGDGRAGYAPAERVIGPVTIRGGLAVVVSFIPGRSADADEGHSWLNILHLCGALGPAPEGGKAFEGGSIRSAGRLGHLPAVSKLDPASLLDRIVLHDQHGGSHLIPFRGERRGQGYWRQDGGGQAD